MIFCVPKEKILPKPKYCFKKSQGQRSLNEKIKFTKDHSKIIENFIEQLKSPKTMAYPNFSFSFTVDCDASEEGLGAVLHQENNGQMKEMEVTLPGPQRLQRKITIYIVEN